MGRLGDGIEQGADGQRDLETAPLWGNRLLTTFLHDGSARSLTEAIRAHDGHGKAARDSFERLNPSQKAQLLIELRFVEHLNPPVSLLRPRGAMWVRCVGWSV